MPSSSGLPDLALDAGAAERIFAAAQVAITPEQATEVTERTEGWPVGLHLAAMIARDARHESWGVSGDDRYVADYLHQEALRNVDPDLQRFLRHTAVLDRLHGRCATRSSERRAARSGSRPSRRRTRS